MAESLPPSGSPTTVPTIELATITLRPITVDDIAFVTASAADPQICRISSVPSPCTPAGAREFIQRQHRRLPDGEGYPLVIEPRPVAPALQGLSDWAFASIECDRHRLWIEPWNVASQRTGERAGFRPAVGVRSFEEINGDQVEVLAWDRTRAAL